MEKKELSMNELDQVSGGWEYDGKLKWLKGYIVPCPYCGSESEDVVRFRFIGNGGSGAHFRCENCNRPFSYHYLSDKIWRFDDNGHGI